MHSLRAMLKIVWCNWFHRDEWLGFGSGDWWHLECPKCRQKWIEPRTGRNPGRINITHTEN